MREKRVTYKDVFKDYLCRGVTSGFSTLIFFIGLLIINIGNSDIFVEAGIDALIGIPIIIAVLGGFTHKIALPTMYYYIPYSISEREDYLQKMFKVKLFIPIVISLIFDCIICIYKAVNVGAISNSFIYAIILQLVTVILLTSIISMTYDGNVDMLATKMAFGNMREWAPLAVALCIFAAAIMFPICTMEISTVEFYVVLCALLIIFLPVLCAVGKRWKTVRKNFADYELATRLEVRR